MAHDGGGCSAARARRPSPSGKRGEEEEEGGRVRVGGRAPGRSLRLEFR